LKFEISDKIIEILENKKVSAFSKFSAESGKNFGTLHYKVFKPNFFKFYIYATKPPRVMKKENQN
jgi:hypothetical protein